MQIPDGMDLGAEMSALCLNYSSGMSKKEATAEFLADMDEKFDTAIMQQQLKQPVRGEYADYVCMLLLGLEGVVKEF